MKLKKLDKTFIDGYATFAVTKPELRELRERAASEAEYLEEVRKAIEPYGYQIDSLLVNKSNNKPTLTVHHQQPYETYSLAESDEELEFLKSNFFYYAKESE